MFCFVSEKAVDGWEQLASDAASYIQVSGHVLWQHMTLTFTAYLPKQHHLIFIYLNINQLDALNFIISLFQASTCFEHHVLIVRRSKFYYSVSGIVTPIVGRPVHGLNMYEHAPKNVHGRTVKFANFIVRPCNTCIRGSWSSVGSFFWKEILHPSVVYIVYDTGVPFILSLSTETVTRCGGECCCTHWHDEWDSIICWVMSYDPVTGFCGHGYECSGYTTQENAFVVEINALITSGYCTYRQV